MRSSEIRLFVRGCGLRWSRQRLSVATYGSNGTVLQW